MSTSGAWSSDVTRAPTDVTRQSAITCAGLSSTLIRRHRAPLAVAADVAAAARQTSPATPSVRFHFGRQREPRYDLEYISGSHKD